MFTQFQDASAMFCFTPHSKPPVTCSGDCFTPDTAVSNIPNECVDLLTKFSSTENSTNKDLHFRFFYTNTAQTINQTINNVSFFINVTKQDKTLEHDLFYTHSGIFTIKFQQNDQVGQETVDGDHDPVLGGWTSPNDTVTIHSSLFTNEGLYHFKIEILTVDYVNNIVDQTNLPTFDSWWFVDEKGNISKYDNNTFEDAANIGKRPVIDKIPSPLKQFKSGIVAKNVRCNNGFLILKAEDGSPACVTIETGKKLAMRGWATTFETGNDYWTSCKTLYPQSDYGIEVLYMPTNSLGKLCVKYYSMNNPSTSVGINIFEANNMSQSATEITHWTYNSTLLHGNQNTTIAYFIKTGNNTGFYGISISGCGGIPFAVGYDSNSTIAASDFPWAGHVFNCPAITYDSQIDSTEGIGVRYIPYSGIP